jgi:hydrogenase maturation protease
MVGSDRKVLVIGYGNPGRLDDGLGPAFVDALESLAIPNVTFDADYQLTVEDAADLAGHDVVVFVDADASGPEPFYLRPVQAGGAEISFSTHHITPEAVVALGREMFDAHPDAYVIGIRGYEFNEFGQRLSDKAQANLSAALAHFQDIVNRDFADCSVAAP